MKKLINFCKNYTDIVVSLAVLCLAWIGIGLNAYLTIDAIKSGPDIQDIMEDTTVYSVTELSTGKVWVYNLEDENKVIHVYYDGTERVEETLTFEAGVESENYPVNLNSLAYLADTHSDVIDFQVFRGDAECATQILFEHLQGGAYLVTIGDTINNVAVDNCYTVIVWLFATMMFTVTLITRITKAYDAKLKIGGKPNGKKNS